MISTIPRSSKTFPLMPQIILESNSFIHFPPTYVSRSNFGFELTSNVGVILVKFFLWTNMQTIGVSVPRRPPVLPSTSFVCSSINILVARLEAIPLASDIYQRNSSKIIIFSLARCEANHRCICCRKAILE
jgi:hypothetical protein